MFHIILIKKMEKLIINSYEDFAARLGEQLGVSEWLEVSQERINQFADATLDHQWIHVDVERAKAETPYKSTIAHGYLTLSLLPYLWDQIIEVASLDGVENLRGICKTSIKFKIEIEGDRKPALEGVATFLYYFN